MIFAISYLCLARIQGDIINVRVNGTLVNPGKVSHNRTMVPTRGVLEKLGVDVRWVPSNRSVIASNATTTITLWIGRPFAQVNGNDLPLEAPPFIDAGTTFVPLRFIAESMHARVGYDAATNTATVDLDNAAPTPQPTPQPTPTPTPIYNDPAPPEYSNFGNLKTGFSNWFVPGNRMHFELNGPPNHDVRVSFSPGVTNDVSLYPDSDGRYLADWTPPQNVDYGDGVLTATVYVDGQPTGPDVRLLLDDPRLALISPRPGQGFSRDPLWVQLRDNTGPGFDIRGVSVTINGNDVTDRATVTGQDIKVDLVHGRNDVHISIRDIAGKQTYYDTTAYSYGPDDRALTYDGPNPAKQGDLIRFRVQGPEHTPFSIMLGDLIRIPWNLIREVRPGQYESSYRVGAGDVLDNAPVRAVFDGGGDPLQSSPISILPLRVDRVRGNTIDGGALLQAFATPGCRLTYVGTDGNNYDFTEQASYPGSYLLSLPLPRQGSGYAKPYIQLRGLGNQDFGRNISFSWPERDLSVRQVWPADGSTSNGVPPIVKASMDVASGPGMDASSINMTLDGQPVNNVKLTGGTDVYFIPGRNLQAGNHRVRLDVQDRLGRPITAQWSFNVGGATVPVGSRAKITMFEFFGRGDITGGQTTTAQFKVTGLRPNDLMTVTSSAPGIAGVPATVPVSSGTFTITSRPVVRQTQVNITLSNGSVSAVLPLTLEPAATTTSTTTTSLPPTSTPPPPPPAPPANLQISELITMPYKDHDAPRLTKITLSAPAPTGGMPVKLTALTPNLVKLAAGVTIRAGNTQIGIPITVQGVDSPQVAQIQADMPGSTKILRIPLVPAKLGPVVAPASATPGSNISVVFNLKSPMGPSGGTLKLSTGAFSVLNLASNVKVPAGATSVTVQVTALQVAGTLTLTGELNRSKASVTITVAP